MKIEGRNAVLELLKTDKEIEKILMEKGAQGSLGSIFAEALRRNIRVQFAEKPPSTGRALRDATRGSSPSPPTMRIVS